MACAQCHDHKYDPIKQKEYYQLYAFFNNVPEQVSTATRGTPCRHQGPHFGPGEAAGGIAKEIADTEAKLRGPLADVDAAQVAWEKEPGVAKTQWRVLQLQKLKSKGGAQFNTDKDGSTVVSGPNTPTDTYTFSFAPTCPS